MGQPQARLYLGLTAAPPARLIEPVAEVFGDLDTQIDGRWQNPVTKKSQFMGFHRLEQILWDEPSLTGATALCQGLMDHEEKLVALVSKPGRWTAACSSSPTCGTQHSSSGCSSR
jgi:hypothetical protein